MEYIQGFINFASADTGPQLEYINMPWAGVRTSKLPDLHFSLTDGTYGPKIKREDIHNWGTDTGGIPELRTMGGFSTFVEDLPDNEAMGLSYVHGTDPTYGQPGSDWYRAPSRTRYGMSGRDFTVFTVNGRIKLPPQHVYTNRSYLINDKMSDIPTKAKDFVPDSYVDMKDFTDYQALGRRLEIFSENANFGVAYASSKGGTDTSCGGKGSSVCVGSTVPKPGLRPQFYITCGGATYFGPNLYNFSPPRDKSGPREEWEPIRSYRCMGQPAGVWPTFKLLGFFPTDNSCSGVTFSSYDEDFCPSDGQPTSAPTKVNSPTKAPTTLPPTRSPTRSPTPAPTPTTGTDYFKIYATDDDDDSKEWCMQPETYDVKAKIVIKECDSDDIQQWTSKSLGLLAIKGNEERCLHRKKLLLRLNTCDGQVKKRIFSYSLFEGVLLPGKGGKKVATIKSDKMSDGTIVHVRNIKNSLKGQKWEIDGAPSIDNGFKIADLSKVWCLQPLSKEIGAKIVVKECDDSLTIQKWKSKGQVQLSLMDDTQFCLRKASKSKDLKLGKCDPGRKPRMTTKFQYDLFSKAFTWKRSPGKHHMQIKKDSPSDGKAVGLGAYDSDLSYQQWEILPQ